MKKYFVFLAGVLIFIAVGCKKEVVTNGNDVCLKKISVNALVKNDSGTKISFVDEGAIGLKLAWSDNESFTVYCGSSSEGEEFSKNNEGNIFNGNVPSGSDTYYAVYGNGITNNSGVLSVDISNQVGTVSDNCITEFMVAQNSSLSNTLEFSHKLAILKLTLTLPSDVVGKVDRVNISGMHNKAEYNLSTASYVTMPKENKGEIIASGEDGNGFVISENSIVAYVSVFPETVAANKIEITAKVGNNIYYYIMKNSNTLVAGQIVPVTVSLKPKAINFATTSEFTDFYWWDAYENYRTGTEEYSEGNHGYNPVRECQASHSCKDCMSKDELISYVKAGCYWDDGTIGDVSNGLQSFTLADGTPANAGLWFLKRAYIDKFGAATTAKYLTTKLSTASAPTTYKSITADNAAEIRTSGKYFFIPVCGYPSSVPSQVNKITATQEGVYWSSTGMVESETATELKANALSFDKAQVMVSKKSPRSSKCRLVFPE